MKINICNYINNNQGNINVLPLNSIEEIEKIDIIYSTDITFNYVLNGQIISLILNGHDFNISFEISEVRR